MFMDRSTISSRFPSLSEGQTVYSRDGERLGKIVDMSDDHIRVEKGIFFPKDFTCRYDDITDVRGDEVYLSLNANELSDWRTESYAGWSHAEGLNTGSLQAEPHEEFRDRYQNWSSEQINVPVIEEELEASKTSRKAGDVKLRKIVHTELRHFTVPVMREELRVERVPVTDRQSTPSTASAGDTAFREKTIDIPVMEEEVTISKRPVVKEEVRVSKERVTEERDVSEQVRKEEVRIEGEDTLRRRKAG